MKLLLLISLSVIFIPFSVALSWFLIIFAPVLLTIFACLFISVSVLSPIQTLNAPLHRPDIYPARKAA